VMPCTAPLGVIAASSAPGENTLRISTRTANAFLDTARDASRARRRPRQFRDELGLTRPLCGILFA
jgi:hypothetical protein